MEWIDYIVIVFLLFALLGLAYSKSHRDNQYNITSLVSEGFADSGSQVKVFLFYSILSRIPGKKCRDNYKLFKENRQYHAVFTKFREYMYAHHPHASVEAINVDEYPDYLQEYDVELTPTIVIDNGSEIAYYDKQNVPTYDELVQFYEKSYRAVKDLRTYDDAVVYLYLPNCRDCKQFVPEWIKFKKELKKSYPDLAVFEVNIAQKPSYKKYTYKFGASVYPLVLTKIMGKISVTDIIELYGSFTADNLFQLVDETIFATPPDADGPANHTHAGSSSVEDAIIDNMYDAEADADALLSEQPKESYEGGRDAVPQEAATEQQLNQLMNFDDAPMSSPAEFYAVRDRAQAAAPAAGFLNRVMNNKVGKPLGSEGVLPRMAASNRVARTPLESRIRTVFE
jgi:hypothetical protein